MAETLNVNASFLARFAFGDEFLNEAEIPPSMVWGTARRTRIEGVLICDGLTELPIELLNW